MSIGKINNIDWASIAKVDNITAADLAAVDGILKPSGGGGGGGIVIEGSYTEFYATAPPGSNPFTISVTAPATQTDSNTGIIVLASGWNAITDSNFDVQYCEGGVCTPTPTTKAGLAYHGNDGVAIFYTTNNWTPSETTKIEITQWWSSPIVVTILWVTGLHQTSPLREVIEDEGTSYAADITTSLTSITQAGDMVFHTFVMTDFSTNPVDNLPMYVTTMGAEYVADDYNWAGGGNSRYYQGSKTAVGSDSITVKEPQMYDSWEDYSCVLASFQPA